MNTAFMAQVTRHPDGRRTLSPDQQRRTRVLAKIAKGLCYHEAKLLLGPAMLWTLRACPYKDVIAPAGPLRWAVSVPNEGPEAGSVLLAKGHEEHGVVLWLMILNAVHGRSDAGSSSGSSTAPDPVSHVGSEPLRLHEAVSASAAAEKARGAGGRRFKWMRNVKTGRPQPTPASRVATTRSRELAVLRRATPRPRLRALDRAFWIVLSRTWSRCRELLATVKPATVIA